MPITLTESQALCELAELLYDFLPGTPHPYAAKDISFPGVAAKLGLLKYWISGSKKPAIIQLLKATLEFQRGKFCALLLEIINTGMVYRNNNPITKEEITNINKIVQKVGFKIPELWDVIFLDSLPSTQKKIREENSEEKQEIIRKLKKELIDFTKMSPQQRGFAFEQFLNKLFATYGIKQRGPYRLIGEQIDGSFVLDNEVYLLEAKWLDRQIGQSDLLVLSGKVGGKSDWSRGLFVSYSGFTSDGLIAFSKGKPTNIIGMDGQDLFHILNGEMTLIDVLREKVIRAGDEGEFFVSVFSLSKGS